MTSHTYPRILIVESDDTTRLFLTDNLSADGYEVQPVADRDSRSTRSSTAPLT